MRRYFLLTSCISMIVGCASVGNTPNLKADGVTQKTLKYCPLSVDKITEKMIAEAIENSVERASSFGGLTSQKTGVDVYRIKGLEVKVEQNKLKYTYLHRQSINIDYKKSAGRQSTFSGTGNYSVESREGCLAANVQSPSEFAINLQKTILFEEIALPASPEELAKDSKNSLMIANPSFRFGKTHKVEGNLFVKKKPKDIATLVLIKDKINPEIRDNGVYFSKYIDTNHLVPYKYAQSNNSEVKFQVLPLNGGSVIVYAANYQYDKIYRSDGTSYEPSVNDLVKIGKHVEEYISSIVKS